MESVVLVIHLMLALALIGLVLIQRHEGGGLGIGGGGLGQFASVRATANILTRATAICAGGFFITSLLLAYLAGTHTMKAGILETYAEPSASVSIQGEGEGEEDTVPVKPPSAPISD
jgi:preprotein translocase subunit SecG